MMKDFFFFFFFFSVGEKTYFFPSCELEISDKKRQYFFFFWGVGGMLWGSGQVGGVEIICE